MHFFKYSGSGNDFIMLDNRKGDLRVGPTEVVSWCKRREGIGADGVVLIHPSDKYDFRFQIFNADGSEAEMCGNGTRCAVHFAFYELKLKQDKQFVFETMNGVYEGEVVDGDEIRIKMTELYEVDTIDVSDLAGKNALFLNTGVPHTVLQVSSVDDVKVKAVGSAIRYDARFPSGTNVDFFEIVDKGEQSIRLRVYERGVEDETLCCGTGIMATAVSCAKFFGWEGEVQVEVKGGKLKAIVDKEFKKLYFQGKVQKIYSGNL